MGGKRECGRKKGMWQGGGNVGGRRTKAEEYVRDMD